MHINLLHIEICLFLGPLGLLLKTWTLEQSVVLKFSSSDQSENAYTV